MDFFSLLFFNDTIITRRTYKLSFDVRCMGLTIVQKTLKSHVFLLILKSHFPRGGSEHVGD
jgi:hypothetical protein